MKKYTWKARCCKFIEWIFIFFQCQTFPNRWCNYYGPSKKYIWLRKIIIRLNYLVRGVHIVGTPPPYLRGSSLQKLTKSEGCEIFYKKWGCWKRRERFSKKGKMPDFFLLEYKAGINMLELLATFGQIECKLIMSVFFSD